MQRATMLTATRMAKSVNLDRICHPAEALIKRRRMPHEQLHKRQLELLVADAVDEKVERAIHIDEDDGEASADELDLEGSQ